jgi:hypothetical protein
VQAIYILKCAIIICEGSSKVNVLSKGPSLFLFDVFFTTKGGLGT